MGARRFIQTLAVLALLVALSACTPRLQGNIEGAIRAFAYGPGNATLAILEDGVRFDPGPVAAINAVIYVGGNDLVEDHEACEPFRSGVICFLEEGGRTITAPIHLAVTGLHLSANVTFYQPDYPVPAFFYVREQPPGAPTE